MGQVRTALRDRVAIVTGAGGGLGRAHALEMASRGAAVVVNDLGTTVTGERIASSAAQSVVEEIRAAGGTAIASCHDIADWDSAGELVELAISEFGGLDVVVNSAGILRDRSLANMTADEWDAVIAVHLRGPAAIAHHAMRWWRERWKSSEKAADAVVIQTSAASALVGAFGQANYSAAKFGVVGLSNVIATEGAKLGVRAVVISPLAQTRMTGESQLKLRPDAVVPTAEQLAAVVAWLAERDCPVNRQFVHVYGDRLMTIDTGAIHGRLHSASSRWTREELEPLRDAAVLVTPLDFNDYLDGLVSVERSGSIGSGSVRS